jgi:hypothetical protein
MSSARIDRVFGIALSVIAGLTLFVTDSLLVAFLVLVACAAVLLPLSVVAKRWAKAGD